MIECTNWMVEIVCSDCGMDYYENSKCCPKCGSQDNYERIIRTCWENIPTGATAFEILFKGKRKYKYKSWTEIK